MLEYSFANKLFYERLAYAEWNKGEEWFNIIKKYIGDTSYSVTEGDFYLKCIRKENCLPVQGWKIHISASLKNISEILDIASEYFINKGIAFKVIKSKELYVLTSQKAFPREMYGKFITAYPKNTSEFKKAILVKTRDIIFVFSLMR